MSAVVAFIITEVYDNKNALILTGAVEDGLPDWQLPWQFNVNHGAFGNVSATNHQSLDNPLEMAEEFGIGLLMLPMVSILQQLAIAKFYTRK